MPSDALATPAQDSPSAAPMRDAVPGQSLRIEEAALNATAVRQQMLYDGWLVRWAPSRAKRMRCISVLGPSTGELDERLAYCAGWYARHGLPMLFRLTSLCPDPSLDAALQARGFVAYDATRVMAGPVPAGLLPLSTALRVEHVDAQAFCTAVGAMRGASAVDVSEHAARVAALAVDTLPVLAYDADGTCIAGALAVFDGGLMGIFDVITSVQRRGQGVATRLMHYLMACAARRGVRQAYLQVESQNVAARALYARLGMSDRYEYWYRSLPDGAAA
ncbi:GNAT family N-acetyltransferase [Bordetella genomosp. 13]|uniref:GNAT family N-acetyltransferase n=1 Tax=Bordetella genomosp. 13 TaxID=463040 RepID=UPI0011A29409|nr:GNAT family N-acetyltransferase [Bordetella genomosp. 13]